MEDYFPITTTIIITNNPNKFKTKQNLMNLCNNLETNRIMINLMTIMMNSMKIVEITKKNFKLKKKMKNMSIITLKKKFPKVIKI